MAEIDLIAHKNLLRRCRNLPFGIDPSLIYEATLKELYKKYKVQNEALKETVRLYNEVALLVDAKRPIAPERKYITIRKTEPV